MIIFSLCGHPESTIMADKTLSKPMESILDQENGMGKAFVSSD